MENVRFVGLDVHADSITARGKNRNKTTAAIARELAGFVWAIAREPMLLAS